MFKQTVPVRSTRLQVRTEDFQNTEPLFSISCVTFIFQKGKEAYTCPAARTLPSVEKVQQSPLFRGATCTGYSSSILQNLTILRGKDNTGSYQSGFLTVLGVFCALHRGDGAERLLCQGRKAGGAAAPCPHSLVVGQAGHVQPVVAEAHRAHPAVVGTAREDWRGRGEQVPADRWTEPRSGTRPQPGQQSSGTHKQTALDQFTTDSAVGTELPRACQPCSTT